MFVCIDKSFDVPGKSGRCNKAIEKRGNIDFWGQFYTSSELLKYVEW